MCSQEATQSQQLPDTCPTTLSQSSQSNSQKPDTSKNPWGYLFSTQPGWPWVGLVGDKCLVGRAPSCFLVLGDTIDSKVRGQFSKEHFEITKNGPHVFITDLSFNGTFLNHVRISSNRKDRVPVPLRNHDKISLAIKSSEGFIYMDSEGDTEHMLPKEVLSKYAISKKLGSGAYGDVHLAFNKSTGSSVAMKVIAKNKFLPSSKSFIHIDREIRILKRLDHPFVIKFIDVIDRPDNVFIAMELVQGEELFSKVEKSRLSERDAKFIFYQLALAVSYLHGQGIIHRDIKLENILLATPQTPEACGLLTVKLADFGLSNFVDTESMLKTYCGTPMYIAPEVLKSEGRKGSYDTQADIWSMGVVLYMCLSGITPFRSGDPAKPLSKQILTGDFEFPRERWRRVSVTSQNLIKAMMKVDPKKRISISGVLRHPWLNDQHVAKKVNRLLGPGRRPGSSYGKENISEEDEDDEDADFGPCVKKARMEEPDTSSIEVLSQLSIEHSLSRS